MIENFEMRLMAGIAQYRKTRRENPEYITMNCNSLHYLRGQFVIAFNKDGSDHFAGIRILIDDSLLNFDFKVVG